MIDPYPLPEAWHISHCKEKIKALGEKWDEANYAIKTIEAQIKTVHELLTAFEKVEADEKKRLDALSAEMQEGKSNG